MVGRRDASRAHLIPQFGELGLLGSTLPAEYGGAEVDSVAYGLIQYELERGDSGLRSFASVMSGLVMYPIFRYGSDAQRKTWLPELTSGRKIGCFGLTESEGGSDPGAMRTRARKDGDSYVLNGSKMWITNSPIADVAVVWAKDDDDVVRGFLVEAGTRRFLGTPKISSKMSLRASVTGEIHLAGLPHSGQQSAARVRRAEVTAVLSDPGPLRHRLGCARGARSRLHDSARVHHRPARPSAARSRPGNSSRTSWFGWSTDHTTGLLLAHRLATSQGRRDDDLRPGVDGQAGAMSAPRWKGARLARELLGGNGITTEYPVIRHMLNLETVDTYEGTHDIHTMIVGGRSPAWRRWARRSSGRSVLVLLTRAERQAQIDLDESAAHLTEGSEQRYAAVRTTAFNAPAAANAAHATAAITMTPRTAERASALHRMQGPEGPPSMTAAPQAPSLTNVSPQRARKSFADRPMACRGPRPSNTSTGTTKIDAIDQTMPPMAAQMPAGQGKPVLEDPQQGSHRCGQQRPSRSAVEGRLSPGEYPRRR